MRRARRERLLDVRPQPTAVTWPDTIATAQETGNISYIFSASLGDDSLFHIFEEWESEEAIGAHFQAPHMAEFGKAMAGLGVKETKLQKYEVSSVAPLG